MAHPSRTPRSLLFAPGDDARKLAKAIASGAGCVVADLEDAVAGPHKERARDTVAEALAARGSVDGSGVGDGGDTAHARCAVRINELGSPQAEGDLAMAVASRADAIVVPKAQAAGLHGLDGRGLPPLIAIVETAAGLQESAAIAAAPGVVSLLLGAVDLGRELSLIPRSDGLELLFARAKLVMDSAAAGIGAPIDVVFVDLADDDGLRAQCALARSLGFGGKACIHPRQIETVERAFAPAEAEIERAERIVRAFESARDGGDGVVAVDGEMVDLPVYERALDIIDERSAGR